VEISKKIFKKMEKNKKRVHWSASNQKKVWLPNRKILPFPGRNYFLYM
jgi:hypothetical protein